MKKTDTEVSASLFPDFEWDPPESRQLQRLLHAYNHSSLFERLKASAFRSRFHLSVHDRQYITQRGMETICRHAEDFVTRRLAPACIPNDGKQTPMRGHPVFIAQHATGCCCRGCLAKWHHIAASRPLTAEEQQYVLSVLMTWINREYSK